VALPDRLNEGAIVDDGAEIGLRKPKKCNLANECTFIRGLAGLERGGAYGMQAPMGWRAIKLRPATPTAASIRAGRKPRWTRRCRCRPGCHAPAH
jgi:hypothetical protein